MNILHKSVTLVLFPSAIVVAAVFYFRISKVFHFTSFSHDSMRTMLDDMPV